MKAIILAAGRGSRMRDATADRPKCLVELGGKPLLHWQMQALRAGGIDTLGAVCGYRGDMLAGRGLTLFTNPRWAETNMVMSLAAAADWLRREPCLVSYADIFYPAATIARLRQASGDLVISYDPDWLTLWRERFDDPLSDAETFRRDADGRIREIGRKPASLDDVQGQYMGLLRFTPAAWGWVENLLAALEAPARDKLDMTGLLGRLIEAGHRIDSVATLPGWGEVDSESDLAYYQQKVDSGALRLPG